MPRPIISYAPPSHHGVTTLMAVGKDDAPEGDAIYFDAGRAVKYAVIGGAVGAVRGGRRTTSYALVAAGLSLLANAFGK